MRHMKQESPFEVGYRAFFDGDLLCLYRPKSHYHREWHRGFNKAFFYNKATHVQSIPEEFLRQV